MTAKIRFALVGTSGIAHAHIAAVKKNHHAELISIYSRSYDRAKHWADRYGLRPAQHFEDILTDRSIDAIIVATEPARHLDYAFLALEAGKHILIEKPIDLNLEKAISFLQQARDYKNIVTVVSQQRFDPGFIALRNNLLNGAVGRPILASLELYWNRTAHYYQEGTKWRGQYGSVLLNQGIHWIDLALWTFGNPHRVGGFSKSTRKELLCSDTAIACIEFPNGPLLYRLARRLPLGICILRILLNAWKGLMTTGRMIAGRVTLMWILSSRRNMTRRCRQPAST